MLLNKEDSHQILEKKENKKSVKFEKFSFIQTLFLWNKETREYWRQNFLINNLIKQKDFSTLFELKKNNYELSEKQEKNLNKTINNTLVDRTYPEKSNIFNILEKYNVTITNENYYHFMISNTFTNLAKQYKNNNINEKNEELFLNIISMLENKDFKKDFHEFIVKDIMNSPQDFGAGINWSMNKNVYYEPLENEHIFAGMTKTQYHKIIKTGIGTEHLLNEYRALAMKAPIDMEILDNLGIDTKSIVEKAQRTLLLKEESLIPEMKSMINKISEEVEKFKKCNQEEFNEEIEKIANQILPNIVKKYLSIDEEYRISLRNIEGKLPSELLLESLSNIEIRVKDINHSINEKKVSDLSVDNRKLKFLKKM